LLKKEIRILGLSSPRESLFKPIIGAIFRGSWWLDGIVTYLPPKLTKSNVPRLATALRETKQYSQIQVAIFSREDILEHKFEDYRRLSELVEFPIFAISKRFPSNVAKYEFVRILQGKSRTTLWINEYSAERARDLYILGCRKGQSAPEAVIVAEQVANTFRYPKSSNA